MNQWENLQLELSAGKDGTGAKYGKECNRCQARENMQPVPSAGNRVTGTERGKKKRTTCNWRQARKKNIQPATSTRKHETNAKRGKTCRPVPSAGNRVTGTERGKKNETPGDKRGKTCNHC